MSKGRPALTAPGTAWLLETRQEELDSKSYGLSPASANESFWSGNISSAQLPSDLSADMHGWGLQRHRRVRHCFQHALQEQGVQMLQAPLMGPSYSSSTSAENGQIFSTSFFSLKTPTDAEQQISLRKSTESQSSHLGKSVCGLSWGRVIPDTFTRASSLHQEQKGGWGPAPKQQETPGDQHDLF